MEWNGLEMLNMESNSKSLSMPLSLDDWDLSHVSVMLFLLNPSNSRDTKRHNAQNNDQVSTKHPLPPISSKLLSNVNALKLPFRANCIENEASFGAFWSAKEVKYDTEEKKVILIC